MRRDRSGECGQGCYFATILYSNDAVFSTRNSRTSFGSPRRKTASHMLICFYFGLKEGRKGSRIRELYISHYESRLETMRA